MYRQLRLYTHLIISLLFVNYRMIMINQFFSTYHFLPASEHAQFSEADVERRASVGIIRLFNHNNIDGPRERGCIDLVVKLAEIRHNPSNIVHRIHGCAILFTTLYILNFISHYNLLLFYLFHSCLSTVLFSNWSIPKVCIIYICTAKSYQCFQCSIFRALSRRLFYYYMLSGLRFTFIEINRTMIWWSAKFGNLEQNYTMIKENIMINMIISDLQQSIYVI